MESIHLIILGIVQGITEFLPISSSGHLIVVREFLNMPHGTNDLAIDAILQLATALSVICYFWRDIVSLVKSAWAYFRNHTDERNSYDEMLIIGIALGTVPAIVAGVLLESMMETVFRSTGIVITMLILGSFLMAVAEIITKKIPRTSLSVSRALYIGLFQCLALIPGVSRSGATISGGLLLGLSRKVALRFSFLLSIPIILGSGGAKLLELGGGVGGNVSVIALFSGFVVSFLVGMGAIAFLMHYLKTNTLWIFIIYRLAFAGVLLLMVW